ncbi:hypothetical protein C8F04DRAFT_1094622 [Mycena alexandri]|uniref:Uncharacterized protein n=1 Tax=Mycena alexandri TaxID=1745969 RepID=A0AAD6X4Z9_9AGAR|nr:hypothetical protein C8F04DRAFT_1094622 [Mycena alexandri]
MFTDSPSAGPSSSTNSSMLTELLSCADDHPKRGVTESESFSSSNLWFPVQNENVSSSGRQRSTSLENRRRLATQWREKARHTTSSWPHTVYPEPCFAIQFAERARDAHKPVAAGLWRRQACPPDSRARCARQVSPCAFDLSRIRPFASSSMEAEVVRHSAAACGSADRRPPPPSPTAPLHPNTSVSIYFKQPVLNAWKRPSTSLDLWKAQRRGNPYLPLMVSLFNPLRAVMPPSYWKSVNTTTKPFDKVVWNIKKPLPSPALRTKLRSRKDCDVASESYSPKAFLTGKLRHHCRVCGRDSLLKRLLLVHYWAARDDALSLANAGDDDKMAVSFPESVFLRDRHDFDDFDDDPMDDPLVVERHPECYPLRLF